MIFASTTVFASTDDYGAGGAEADTDLTLKEMLDYAIQDEYLARAEYEAIMEEFDVTRPFSNIMEAEEQHISALLPLFEKYGIPVPEDTAAEHVVIPETLKETFEIGVQAEIDNIAMYEKFLTQPDLPEDMGIVFTALRDASVHHLAAFERGLERIDSRPARGGARAVGNGPASGNGPAVGNGPASVDGPAGPGKAVGRPTEAAGNRNNLGGGGDRVRLQDGNCLD
ncbi:DUF2202 domain-containing protein [Clostridiales bacterium F-3ap]|uniref:DUF2202 domain-containing protein n=2 Tax=Anaerotalea alkaliphila TaxID=2662126 RepID=A0A7X5HV66_9FIRM|nr:DUF2202 domain-containing protein [Anaerotalea alkaliphila]